MKLNNKIMFLSFTLITVINLFGIIELFFNIMIGSHKYFIYKNHFSLIISIIIFFIINKIPYFFKKYIILKKNNNTKDFLKKERLLFVIMAASLFFEFLNVITNSLSNQTLGEPIILMPLVMIYFTTLLTNFFILIEKSDNYFPWV